jgi:hypothetical protein
MNIEIEIGAPPPEVTRYQRGFDDARKVQHKYSPSTITDFERQLSCKHDFYTRGFIAGLKDKK